MHLPNPKHAVSSASLFQLPFLFFPLPYSQSHTQTSIFDAEPQTEISTVSRFSSSTFPSDHWIVSDSHFSSHFPISDLHHPIPKLDDAIRNYTLVFDLNPMPIYVSVSMLGWTSQKLLLILLIPCCYYAYQFCLFHWFLVSFRFFFKLKQRSEFFCHRVFDV